MKKLSKPDRVISLVPNEFDIIAAVWLTAFLLRDWLLSLIEKLCPFTGICSE
jgi:hypothetical protein